VPNKPKPKITAWSFSRWSTYDNCPFQARCRYIDKLPEPEGPALVRGGAIHKIAEDYVSGPRTKKRMPLDLVTFVDEFHALRKERRYVRTELQLAFTSDWKLTGWFDHDTWLRVKIDALKKISSHLTIIDYKTGRVREGYEPQLELYALAGFLGYDDARTIDTQLWFLDHGVQKDERYTAEQLEMLRETWTERVRPMLRDRRFDPNPGDHCRWCAFSKSKGGPCKF
jgi:RecB family exonuclease